MSDIYGGGFLTISAAVGPDVHHGLSPQQISFKPRFPLQKDPLYSRAWALQERMLSPRSLIFGRDQIYWECEDSQQGKDGTRVPPIISQRLKLQPSTIDWHTIVIIYASRVVTHEKDKLPALLGLAKLYQQATKKDYLAGLWKQTLLKDLLWKEQHLIYGNKVSRGYPSQYRAPSWSWASIDGNIAYLRMEEAFRETRVVGTYTDEPASLVLLEGTNTLNGWICLCGYLLQADIIKGVISFHAGGSAVAWVDLREVSRNPEAADINKDPDGWSETDDRSNVWCLSIITQRVWGQTGSFPHTTY
jgi:hypothetical protein